MGKDKIRKFVAAVDIRHLQLNKASSGAFLYITIKDIKFPEVEGM